MSRTPSLRARLQPLADKFTDDLARLIEQRVERDLERVSASLAVALSAFASEMADLSDEGPMPIDTGHARPSIPPPAPAAIVEPLVVSVPAPVARPAATNGKKSITCKSCGFVGGNARGCGTAHVTQPLAKPVERDKFRNAAPAWAPLAVEPPPVRAPQPKPTSARVSVIAQRATGKHARRELEDSNANARERWTSSEIDEERERAEGSKHEGHLPNPHSSFRVAPSRGAEDLGEVEELNFEVDG